MKTEQELREEIIKLLNYYTTSMAGHSWLLGISPVYFEKIADEIIVIFTGKLNKL